MATKGRILVHNTSNNTIIRELVLYEGEYPEKESLSIILEPQLNILLANYFLDMEDDAAPGKDFTLPDDLLTKAKAFAKANEELQKYVLLLAPLLR